MRVTRPVWCPAIIVSIFIETIVGLTRQRFGKY
jgi:hypothetical protein